MKKYQEIIKVVIIYAIFGSVWIYFSDTALNLLVSDPKVLMEISIYKGLLFIIATSVLLFFLTSNLVTKVKQSTKALRESQERLHFVVKNSSDSLVILNADGSQRYVSPGAEKLSGFPITELEGKTLDILIHPDDVEGLMAAWKEVVEHPEKTVTVQYRHIHKTKKWVFSEAVAQSFLSDPMINGIIASVRDITERKRVEEENRKLTFQLQQARKLEAIGSLAGGIAHDFNNILGAIIGYAEIVKDDFPAGSASINDINQVLKASHRAKDLVKQILTFSRQVEAQKIPMQPAIIINEAINMLRASLPTTITIKQDIDPDVGIILTDPSQIHQIVVNLCTNAFHAMEMKGGTLTISLHKKVLSQEDPIADMPMPPGDYVQLSIKDTGTGISPEILDKIFDPYFTTKEIGKGTGLGLSIVHGIVQSYGGSIVCDSQLGEGTVFNIMLPIVEEHALQVSKSAEQVPVGKEHILLIDDEQMLLDIGKTMLERLGYRVTARNNCIEALATFQKQQNAFDMIITDQTMPGMNGIDLARRILQIRPDLPIILCTGYSSLITEEKAKAMGIKGFAMKPLAKKDIAELIRSILDGKNSD
jgi:PAS domain S-box-containing protein